MTDRELIARRLAGQHLTAPADALTTAGDLCGIQAQFYPQALHALRLRGGTGETAGLVKSWTLRGTLHLFPERDLPLFLHAGRTPFLRPRNTLAGDEVVSEARKAYFADCVLDRLSEGPALREELKAACRAAGMTPEEEAHLFDAWGGLPRALCEAGEICHAAQDGKVFRRCPAFVPLERDAARRELLRRYFAHYGPARLRDAAHFLGASQRTLTPLLPDLPLREETWRGEAVFSLDAPKIPDTIPEVLLLAGFDPLLLGYDKREDPLLPEAYRTRVYRPGGMLLSSVLLRGRIAAVWKRTGRKLTITAFEPLSAADMAAIEADARRLFPELRIVAFPEG